jgi:hypothetical protein
MIYIFLFFSIIINIVLIYSIFNLLKKFEIYEDWVIYFKSEINKVYGQLKNVDNRNLFERDDDVGFVFSEIVRIITEFNQRIQ